MNQRYTAYIEFTDDDGKNNRVDDYFEDFDSLIEWIIDETSATKFDVLAAIAVNDNSEWFKDSEGFRVFVNFEDFDKNASKRDTLVTTDYTHQTWQTNAKPDCPICCVEVSEDDDGTPSGCHHYLGGYQPFYHDDEVEDEYIDDATHLVISWHDRAGHIYWYFAASAVDDVMTAAEVADTYSIANATVRQTIARGAIRARKSGSTWLILRSDAERFWNRNAVKGVTTWMATVLAVLAIVSQL